MKVAIYGKSFEQKYAATIIRLFEKLEEHRFSVVMHRRFFEYIQYQLSYRPKVVSLFDSYYDMDEDISYFFSIGGDGTFLQAVSFVREKEIPIIGFNIGRLGFLADIQEDDMDDALKALIEERYEIEERALIEVLTTNQLFEPFNMAMNDVTVHKKNSVSMITIHAYLNEVFLNAYWADGLIISTPTGSTAYSMSVGGPIVLPSSESFIITPIASHNLTVRPLVVPDKTTIRLQVNGRTSSFFASLDSRMKVLNTSEEITLRKATYRVKMLKLPGHSYYTTLRNKLMWGLDKRN